ncbi:MAG TPA: hypothetical protein VNY06_04650 [Methylocella sp.]|nr:hypothetical protein [Methylocella sp.]
MVTQSAEQHPHSERVSEAAESANKASLAKIVILSLLAHICLVLALVRLDPLSFPASGSREIPVQVVVAEPPPPQSPAAARKETPVNERAPQETVEAQNGTNAHGAASEGEGAKEGLPGAQPSLPSMQRRIVFVVLRYPLRRQTALKR